MQSRNKREGRYVGHCAKHMRCSLRFYNDLAFLVSSKNASIVWTAKARRQFSGVLAKLGGAHAIT